MQGNLHLLSNKPINTHTIFVDSKEEVEEFDPVEYFNTIPEAVERSYNRPKLETLKTEELFVNKAKLKKVEIERNKNYTELLSRMDREKNMQSMLEKMTLQKHLMNKGRRIKVTKGEDQSVYKWKRERKK